MAQVFGGRADGGRNLWREDLVVPCAVPDDVLAAAPIRAAVFRVPKGIER